jgi:hypothetical protein
LTKMAISWSFSLISEVSFSVANIPARVVITSHTLVSRSSFSHIFIL